jgi:hypothetical protein
MMIRKFYEKIVIIDSMMNYFENEIFINNKLRKKKYINFTYFIIN